MKPYLSAVRQLHVAKDYPDPKVGKMPKLVQVLRGIKREQAIANTPARERLPITPSILRKLRVVWERNGTDPDYIMLWAAACLCFFGFMRAGEITLPSEQSYDPEIHLNFSDIAIDNHKSPKLMKVRLKTSKTDQFRRGIDIYVGTTNTDLCPVTAMMSFLAVRKNNQQGFLFTFKDGRVLTKSRFIDQVRQAMRVAG